MGFKYKEIPVNGIEESKRINQIAKGIAKKADGYIPERVVEDKIFSGVKAISKERRICRKDYINIYRIIYTINTRNFKIKR